MKLAEDYKVVLVTSNLDYNTGAIATTKGINMKNYHRCTYLIDIGTLGVADVTIKAYSGIADMSLTSALAFKYAYGGSTALWAAAGTTPAAGADVLAAEVVTVAATGLVVTQVTYANYLLIIEIDASIMDLAAATPEPWLSLSITCGAATGLASVFAILEPRYSGNLSVTALA